MIKTMNVGILEAIKEIKIMSLNKRLRLRYEEHMKTIRDRNTREDYVREEGHAQGHMEGHAQGRVLGREEAICDLVQKKLANGESIPQIAKDLLDTPEHISEIIEHSGNHPRETL